MPTRPQQSDDEDRDFLLALAEHFEHIADSIATANRLRGIELRLMSTPSSRPGGEPQPFTRAELTALEKCVLLIDPRSLMVDHGAAQSALAKIRALLPPETP